MGNLLDKSKTKEIPAIKIKNLGTFGDKTKENGTRWRH